MEVFKNKRSVIIASVAGVTVLVVATIIVTVFSLHRQYDGRYRNAVSDSYDRDRMGRSDNYSPDNIGKRGYQNQEGSFGMMGERRDGWQGNGSGKRGQSTMHNCVADECLNVDNLEYPVGALSDEAKTALNRAIDDEYKALATYEKTIETIGSKRPFSMIVRAEEQHISALKSLFDKYGITIPENQWMGKADAPASLTEACQTGVSAETANAKLYRDELLPAVRNYEDITGVFTNLMNASQRNHLPAFERCSM